MNFNFDHSVIGKYVKITNSFGDVRFYKVVGFDFVNQCFLYSHGEGYTIDSRSYGRVPDGSEIGDVSMVVRYYDKEIAEAKRIIKTYSSIEKTTVGMRENYRQEFSRLIRRYIEVNNQIPILKSYSESPSMSWVDTYTREYKKLLKAKRRLDKRFFFFFGGASSGIRDYVIKNFPSTDTKMYIKSIEDKIIRLEKEKKRYLCN